MGYSFRPARAYQTAKLELAMKSLRVDQQLPPIWLKVLEQVPPPEILTRPKPIPHRDPNPKQRKPKNLFKPQRITFPEDELRRNFFKDHPWELARPRIAVEYDGKDSRYVNWATGLRQPRMPVTGESVVQRQLWLMENGVPQYAMNEATGETEVVYSTPLTKAQAYDIARKEFYTIRQQEDIERRISQEEARMVGAYFGKNKLQVGMELEDRVYNNWKRWAEEESAKLAAEKESAYSNFTAEESKSTLAELELETEGEVELQQTNA